MYQDGVAKLIDFGIAKVSLRSTHGSSVKGTHNWMSPEQGLSEARKTFTLCDVFSFGLIVKWLLVGVRTEIPFKDAQIDHIFREHARLHSSAGSLVHPYVEDLSLVPPVFRTLIQFCTATDASKRWTAPKAMWELEQLKSRLTAADPPLHPPPPSVSPLAAAQGSHIQGSPPPSAPAAAAARSALPRKSHIAATSSQAPENAPVTRGNWPALLLQLRAALTPEAVASFRYYRDMTFAADISGELSDFEAGEGALADAAQYAAASKKLHAIVAGQGSPSAAETLATLLAQVKHTMPAIEAAQDAAKSAKDYAAAAELQELRWGAFVRALLTSAEFVLLAGCDYFVTGCLF